MGTKGAWKTYRYVDGLAHNRVLSICEDREGYLWFGTWYAGASRYDGRTWRTFSSKDGLSSSRIEVIHRDGSGILWFGGEDGDVCCYDGKNLTVQEGLYRARAIYEDREGNLWFHREDGVACYDGKTWKTFMPQDGLARGGVHAIYEDRYGSMWFGTWGGGLSCYDGEAWTTFTTEDGLASNWVNAIDEDRYGYMWIGTEKGVTRYDGMGFFSQKRLDSVDIDRVHVIYKDKEENLWFGTDQGAFQYDGEDWIGLAVEDGMVSNRVQAIYEDRFGSMWFGTNHGVSRYDKSWVQYTIEDGLSGNSVFAIHRDRAGCLWFGTSHGVNCYDGTSCNGITAKKELSSKLITSICEDKSGNLWFATLEAGVTQYDGESWTVFTTADGLAHDDVWSILEDKDGSIWVGTGSHMVGHIGAGVSRYDGGTWATFTPSANGIAWGGVQSICQDRAGHLWIGSLGGLSRYDGKMWVNLSESVRAIHLGEKVHSSVRAIHEDESGNLWIGTYGAGLICYDGKAWRTFTTEDGLSCNRVNVIYEAPNGNLWLGTDGGGISQYDGRCFQSLNTKDGLAGDEVHSIYVDDEGGVWIGTDEGVSVYTPGHVPPEISIVQVIADKNYDSPSGVLMLPSSAGRVTFSFHGISFRTQPDQMQYLYQLVGHDEDWRGPIRKESVEYFSLKPGKYTFEVRAIDRDLNYSQPASVKTEVLPDPRNHRIAQLESELEERERAEMERIYRDLEDARQIQQSLLPEEPPAMEGFEIAGISVPAREVSGDFYGYLSLGGNVGIVLADVTGKSVKAAMIAALADGMLNAEIKSRKELWDAPSKILRELNMGLHPRLIPSMYTAMSLGILQAESKRLLFSNAGMPYPIVKRGSEAWELELSGMPLGLIKSAEYEDFNINLEPGDFVVFCSDGVTEAMDKAEEMYQIGRLLEVIQQADPGLSAQEMLDLIAEDIAEFAGDIEPSDDITIVVLRREE